MSGPNTTVWTPPTGEGEYTLGTAATLVDAASNSLADAAGNTLVDNGSTFTPVPITTWSENDTG